MVAVYCQESVVRRHHAYKNIWTPSICEFLVARKGNGHDRCAVALTLHDGVLIGHVPREFSKVAWRFIAHGGCISYEVTGMRRRDTIGRLGLVVHVCTLRVLIQGKREDGGSLA